VPDELRAAYGDSPVSTHVFVRLRWGARHATHDRHPME
jgi:hypothetical protein